MLAANGNATTINAYDEYGQAAAANTGRFQYTGPMWLGEAQLYHYKARAYLPALGRFAQSDPILYAGGMNLYAYVQNDPVNLRDPTGLCMFAVADVGWSTDYGSSSDSNDDRLVPPHTVYEWDIGGGGCALGLGGVGLFGGGDGAGRGDGGGGGGGFQPTPGPPIPFNIWFNELRGGHVIARHLFQSLDTLGARGLRRASAFFDLSSAEGHILRVLNDPRSSPAITHLLAQPFDPNARIPANETLIGIFPNPTGYDQFGRLTNEVTVVLYRDAFGFYVRTAFPSDPGW